ncbi:MULTISPECIES: hypothetical protein [Rhizobium]|uniref:Uncharacterized protein n=1 Tax=Rhizobium aouanii TaxID=3118145 RepID=A0ABU8CJ35_9HYPH|nr:hypothetical protein [Rhizobium acaciae]MCW1750269.1 hypothetical protein [Rhizobium acaciae]
MGSFTHVHGSVRPVPPRIESDEDVLAAAAEIVALGADAPIGLSAEALEQSGLLPFPFQTISTALTFVTG